MKKKLIFAIFAMLFVPGAIAQNIRNNITLELTGGLSPFTYKTNIGDRRGMPGTSAAIKYQYNIDWNWSAGLGVELKMYQSSTRFDTFSDYYITEANSLISGKADEMRFSYSYTNLEERQRALYINIPIFTQYRFDNGIYIRLGAKLGMPTKSKSEIYFEELKTEGYFALENVTYKDLPQHGFGTYYDREITKRYNMAMNVSICAEMGWTWDWNEQYMLYIGVHGEYGFANLYKRTNLTPQLVYTENGFEYTPVWNADVVNGDGRVAITNDKIGTFAIGLLIRYSFGF